VQLVTPSYSRCTVATVNDALADERLAGVLEVIDRWGELYERRWGKQAPHQEQAGLASQVGALIDEVRKRTKLAHDVITAMGEEDLAAKIVEHEEGQFGGHPFTQARVAIVEAIAILAQREELAEIVGPVGPRLVASELHPAIWGAAARLWPDSSRQDLRPSLSPRFCGPVRRPSPKPLAAKRFPAPSCSPRMWPKLPRAFPANSRRRPVLVDHSRKP
jgi:hypothetical protein